MNCPHGVDRADCPACKMLLERAPTLRVYLADATDEQWCDFLNGYALATVAGFLVERLGADGRQGFFATIMGTYDVVTGERRLDDSEGSSDPDADGPAVDSDRKNVIPMKPRG